MKFGRTEDSILFYFLPSLPIVFLLYNHFLMAFNVSAVRRQFPYLDRIAENESAYLDNASTTQTPKTVIMTMGAHMSRVHGNVHRGQHMETEVSTAAYEASRTTVQKFIGAEYSDEIIFTKNATEGINMVMRAWALNTLEPGDCIVISKAEHHANIVPWLQMVESGLGVNLIWVGVDENGWIDTEELKNVIDENDVKLVAITGQSNVTGEQYGIAPMMDYIHERGARVLIDAAQLAAHSKIDVTEMKCDFLVFSGHKIYGPTGIGVLYASRDAQKEMSPFMGGGGMVQEVTLDGFTPADAPACFEAGTPPIAEAIGLAAAIEWQSQFNWKDREEHDRKLIMTAVEELKKIDGLNFIGGDPMIAHGTLAFTIEGVHPHDLTDIIGKKGVALRAGHHCAQPLHTELGIPASTRLSVGIYNTEDEIRMAAKAIEEAVKILKK
jgi:cysteine desulfurase/selenocysteine lyase